MPTKKSKALLEAPDLTLTRYVRTSANYSPDTPDVYEFIDPVSDTVPDMGVDLRLMLDRSSQGIPVPTRNDGYSEDDYPDIFKMDEFELVEFRENLAHEMNEMKDQLHVASKKLEELDELARKKPVTNEEEKSSESQKNEEKPSSRA